VRKTGGSSRPLSFILKRIELVRIPASKLDMPSICSGSLGHFVHFATERFGPETVSIKGGRPEPLNLRMLCP